MNRVFLAQSKKFSTLQYFDNVQTPHQHHPPIIHYASQRIEQASFSHAYCY
jgi:hypothetical protein